MNKKAGISKGLNAKHVKILEGLLKLPENRICADCKNIGPRWASINLGIFICLQCSGIHRSFGVHISKVRSATLDTWLPEQVAFMQRMGNEKSNAYYEAELPLHFDRGRFQDFIRSKYVERTWVPKDRKVKSPLTSEQELASPPSSSSVSSRSITDSTVNRHLETKERSLVDSREELPFAQADLATEQHLEKNGCSLVERIIRDADHGNPELPKDGAEDQTSDVGQKKDLQKTRPVDLEDQSVAIDAVPVAPSPKVDYATELFRMLCVDDSAESDLSPSSDTSPWVDFDTDEEETIQEKVAHAPSSSKVHPEPKIDTLDVNGSQAPYVKGRTSIIHSPGIQLQMLNIPQAKFAANTAPYITPSLYRPEMPLNGVSATPARRPPVALPISGYDYDFSFLTQGMFTK